MGQWAGRGPGLTTWQINAGIVRDLAVGIANNAPKAFVLVISNPVNSTVPIVTEVFKKAGVYDPKRIFGVTTLDVVRASTFVAEKLGDLSKASSVTVPVVGGHSGVTIVPLFSQASHPLPSGLAKDEFDALVKRVQFGGDEVVQAKAGTGSATLSMAYAGAEFAIKVIDAINGKSGIIAPTYVHLSADKAGGDAIKKEIGRDLEYFSSNVELGVSICDRFVYSRSCFHRFFCSSPVLPSPSHRIPLALPWCTMREEQPC